VRRLSGFGVSQGEADIAGHLELTKADLPSGHLFKNRRSSLRLVIQRTNCPAGGVATRA
jgi:hypothetical protein